MFFLSFVFLKSFFGLENSANELQKKLKLCPKNLL